MTTKIEWVLNRDGTKGETWNPITGCSKISLGCKNCYAERIAKRLAGRVGYPEKNPFQVTIHPERLNQPLTWKRGVMIFLCSMSDFLHEDISENFILRVFDIIRRCPQHTFQVLTKRSDRLQTFSQKIGNWPANVWVGVTVESSDYKSRIDDLREINAPVRFISFEPLLGDIGRVDLKGIDWVIVGGESGIGARKMKLQWVTNIRDQCVKNSVPFFFKQWGGINKKLAGRKLQGKEWSQMPLEQNLLFDSE